MIQVIKCVPDVGNVVLFDSVFAPSTTAPARLRIRTKGTAVKAKWWLCTDSEPATWNWSGTDTSIATGKVWLSSANGGDSSYTEFDNATLRIAASSAQHGTRVHPPRPSASWLAGGALCRSQTFLSSPPAGGADFPASS